ncbi:MAG TPA: hypothetical protein VHW71_09235 [Steroidobacteraceae bacterium]|jgi:hypothetical protein|nr:hypothetical protein [Steroidobacteraceae bacterium]
MQNLTKLRSLTLSVCASFALAAPSPAFAQHAGGHAGGHAGVAGHGFGGGHAGFGGWHGGFGWRGGCCGWRGGFWGPWGWGWGGVGLGYYSTYWWGGVPYYYADNTYYRWDPAVGQYQTVAPPELIVYPKNGQSQEQLGKDKFECHRWAVGQTGFDPTQSRGGAAPGNRSNYTRAQAACLEGRGYSVK